MVGYLMGLFGPLLGGAHGRVEELGQLGRVGTGQLNLVATEVGCCFGGHGAGLSLKVIKLSRGREPVLQING